MNELTKKNISKNTQKIIVNKRSWSFFSVLTLMLIFLKLTNQIQIGWGWIITSFFGPIILTGVIIGSVIGIFLIGSGILLGFAYLIDLFNKYIKKRR